MLRIDNAPKQFKLDRTNASGSSEAAIYRQWPFPQPVLLMVWKKTANWGEGADWDLGQSG